MRKANSKTKKDEPTSRDILDAVNKFATYTEAQFSELRGDMAGLKKDVTVLKEDVTELKEDVTFLKRNMVTKIYLDEKNGALRGDITELVHKEDRKFIALIHLLEDKDVLSEEDAVSILSMPPFPLGQSL